MAGLVLRRALQALGVVLAAATLTFLLLHLAPGDPVSAALDHPGVSAAVRDRWRHLYGIDRPLGEQYLRWLVAAVRGDLGYSISLQRPVADALADALPNTLVLMGVSIALSFAVGIGTGIYQALRPGTLGDRLLSRTTLLFYSLPDFWLALMAVLVFASWLGIAPLGGMVDVMYDYKSPGGQAVDRLKHLVLPALTLALLTAAGVARYQRSALLDVLGEDFARTARAKGLAPGAVVRRHLLPNAVVPVIVLLGTSLPALVGGAVVIEKVFSWPGMGLLTVNAIAARDYLLVTGSVVVGSLAVAVGSLLADVLHAIVDPRVRAR